MKGKSMRFQKVWFALFLVVAVLILGVTFAFGQVDAGAVRGTVTDSSGAVVPNAKVSLTNDGTGFTVSTMTSGNGSYTFSPVKIGSYTLKVEAPGFKQGVAHLTVNVQQQAEANFTVVAQGTSEQVSVTAEAPQLQTQEASLGTVATQQQINSLPLNSRNYTFLAQLGAGVTSISPTRGLDQTGSFVANGLPTVHNNYILDGIDNNNDTVDYLNGAAYVNLPPPDAIQEFKVQTSNFSAELGRAGGAVVNATIRSGTNQFHGTLWEFLRNDKLDAMDVDQYFTDPNLKKKGELRRNQFGAAAGGPIIKNKWFIFGDYEGTRIRTGVERLASVPTDLQRNSNFTDFRDLLPAFSGSPLQDALGRSFNGNTIFDPATTRAVTAGQVDPVTGLVAQSTGHVRDPFYTNGSVAGITNFTTPTQLQYLNQLPANRLDPNAIKILQLYPGANAPGTVNNYQVLRSQPDNNNHFDIRSDLNLSDKNQLFGRFSYSKRTAFFPAAFTGPADNSSFGQGAFDDRSINLAVSETHVFSPTLVNEARFGYSKLDTSSQPPSANTTGIPDQYGIPGIPQASGNGGLPTIDINGLTSLGAGAFASPNRRTSDTIQFTENLTKIHGAHSFKGGFEYQRLHFPWIDPGWSRGEFGFNGYSGIPNVSNGSGMADILLTPIPATVPGGVNNVGGASSVFASNITQPDDLRNYYGAYFQDDWKATPKLTVNMGLRWEVFGQIGEASGRQAGLLPGDASGAGAVYEIVGSQKNTTLSPSFTNLLQKDRIALKYVDSITTTPLTNFAPRVGVAYQVTNKLVARAGYGIFYGGFENLGGAPDPGYNYPFAVNLSFFAPNQASPLLYPNGQQATLENGLTAANPSPDSPNFSANGLGLIGFQRPWKTAYTQEWNGAVQYQFASDQTVTVAYIGSNSQHLLNGDKRNIPSVLLPPGTDQSAYIPFPDFGRNSDYVAANASSYYKSLEVSYERRFSHGLNMMVNYTRSVCKTDDKNILGINDSLFGRAPTLAGWSLKKDYAYCGSDSPNIFHTSGIWELPVGKDRLLAHNAGGIVNAIIGGWSTQWIYTLQDGFPFSVFCNPPTTATASSTSGCYALAAQGQNIYANAGPHGTTQFLNPAAFVTPPAVTTVGQTDYSPLGGPPTQAHGPAFNTLDLSLFKQFHTTEKTRLEFRSEFFNALNHPNFSNTFVSLDYRNTAQFGKIDGTRGIGREIQLALKFYW